MLKDLVLKNRSYRRFYQDEPLPRHQLEALIELARLSPSAANRQPLKYIISNTPELNAIIFDCLSWAGYLHDWPGPQEGERPSAYIIILNDTVIGPSGCDHGIAAQNIMLGAVEQGWGGCIIGSVKSEQLAAALALPAQFQILLVLALGKPKETVVLEPVDSSGNIKYWRDADNIHHVPKRSVEQLIIPVGFDCAKPTKDQK